LQPGAAGLGLAETGRRLWPAAGLQGAGRAARCAAADAAVSTGPLARASARDLRPCLACAGNAGRRVCDRRDRLRRGLRHELLPARGGRRFPLCLLVRAGDARGRGGDGHGALRERDTRWFSNSRLSTPPASAMTLSTIARPSAGVAACASPITPVDVRRG